MSEEIITRNHEIEKEESKPISLKEQLQQRLDQLEMNRKQVEAQYIEIIGMISELKRTLTLIP